MSESDDSNDKITVLFSDHEEGDKDRSEQPEDEMQKGDTGADGDPSGADVVHLDFDRAEKQDRGVYEIDAGDDDASLSEAKYEVFQTMIGEGKVMVTLDTRAEGVEVPPEFEGLPELRLNFSHLFHIDDFDYDGTGVRASLSFDGTRHFCDVPWSSVSMLYSHETGELAVFKHQES